MGSFDGEEFFGGSLEMALVTAIDLVAPLASLQVEIVPVLERAAREEVPFDEPEGALDTSGTILSKIS